MSHDENKPPDARSADVVEWLLQQKESSSPELRAKQTRLLAVLKGGKAANEPLPSGEQAGADNPQQPLADSNLAWFERNGLLPKESDERPSEG